MGIEPKNKRVAVFFDCQNIFHAANGMFGYTYPDQDPFLLANSICSQKEGWKLEQLFFYTGMADHGGTPNWMAFWEEKLGRIGRNPLGKIVTRKARLRKKVAFNAEWKMLISETGLPVKVHVIEERGIDEKIVVDVLGTMRKQNVLFPSGEKGMFDVAIIFSDDRIFTEVAGEIREISREQNRWIRTVIAIVPRPNIYFIDKKFKGTFELFNLNADILGKCCDNPVIRK